MNNEENNSEQVEPSVDQPLEQPIETPVEPSGPSPFENPTPKKPRSKKLIILIIILVLAIAAAGTVFGLQYFLPKTSESTSSTEQTKNETPAPKTAYIYLYTAGELVAVNPETKEFTILDNKLPGESGNLDYGSSLPLTSPDFYSAAYVKDNGIWVLSGIDSEKIFTLKAPEGTADFYTTYVSAWSSDSSKLAFAVGFSCPPEGNSTCNESMENKDTSGIYVYDVATKETTKQSIRQIIQWIPSTTQIAYFDNSTSPKALLSLNVADKTTKTLSTQQFGFGPQTTFSDDGKKTLYADGVNGGTDAAEIVISNIDGSERTVLKNGAFAELQFPKFLPNSGSDYVYSKQKKITCYEGTSGCVEFYVQLVKGGVEKELVGPIEGKVAGFYNNQAIVVSGDGQNGLSPNNPEAYKTQLDLVNLDTSAVTTIYKKSTPKTSDADGRIYVRIGQ